MIAVFTAFDASDDGRVRTIQAVCNAKDSGKFYNNVLLF